MATLASLQRGLYRPGAVDGGLVGVVGVPVCCTFGCVVAGVAAG